MRSHAPTSLQAAEQVLMSHFNRKPALPPRCDPVLWSQSEAIREHGASVPISTGSRLHFEHSAPPCPSPYPPTPDLPVTLYPPRLVLLLGAPSVRLDRLPGVDLAPVQGVKALDPGLRCNHKQCVTEILWKLKLWCGGDRTHR